jgi:hypothetical protein
LKKGEIKMNAHEIEKEIKEDDLKRKVKSLAAELARQQAEETGKDYHECISAGLDEACERLGVNRKSFIKMFL